MKFGKKSFILETLFSRKPTYEGLREFSCSYSESAWPITYNPVTFIKKPIGQLEMFPRQS